MSWTSNILTEPVILHPRPLERRGGGILLLPLLPYPNQLQPLPGEIWSKIFTFVYDDDEEGVEVGTVVRRGCELLTVCKRLHAIASPVFYSSVRIRTVWALEKFTCRLHSAEQKWDSIRRIPYSAPGRWVQRLDLSKLDCTADAFVVDELLTRLFPLLPFMTRFVLNTSIVLSRRALGALTFRDGTQHLRILKGIKVPAASTGRDYDGAVLDVDNDPLVQLVRNSVRLEELEIIGPGVDSVDVDFAAQVTDTTRLEDEHPPKAPLRLEKLENLTILSTHSSPLLFALLVTNLPSLRRLTVTPYDDIPYPASLVSRFIQVHGQTLRSLYLFTPRGFWPTDSHPSPRDLLIHCPSLRHLSLEFPLPRLILPPREYDPVRRRHQQQQHPLQILSIPRPKSEYLVMIESMIPALKNMRVVRVRDVRWLRKGMTPRALEAGIQGEMRDWRRRLSSKGIAVLDADGKDVNQ